MSENIPDEIRDECADKARELWSSLRDTAFHDGRNRIAAALRQVAADAYEDGTKVAMIEPCEGHHHGHKCAEYIADDLKAKAAALRPPVQPGTP